MNKKLLTVLTAAALVAALAACGENNPGGKPEALNCLFEDNEYAIWV